MTECLRISWSKMLVSSMLNVSNLLVTTSKFLLDGGQVYYLLVSPVFAGRSDQLIKTAYL